MVKSTSGGERQIKINSILYRLPIIVIWHGIKENTFQKEIEIG